MAAIRTFGSSTTRNFRLQKLLVLSRVHSDVFTIPRRHKVQVEDLFKKTTADILNEDEGTIMIDSYSPIGFRLNNGMNIIGPAAVFPRTVLHWSVASSADINEDSLSLFTMLEPKLDILVIGKGSEDAQVDPMVIKYLRTKGIGLELLPTDKAISLLNFLLSERRLVAGALIPPPPAAMKHMLTSPGQDQPQLDKPHVPGDKVLTHDEIRERLRRTFGSTPPHERWENEYRARLRDGLDDEGRTVGEKSDRQDGLGDEGRTVGGPADRQDGVGDGGRTVQTEKADTDDKNTVDESRDKGNDNRDDTSKRK